ncbi:hypothetical protein FKW77_002254 [Venturia effusa]|uniref:Lytic polysaccharide monooxygenase n=1 Tax=Venturia effusa TaxID=50376 RepID=A0A517LDC3_9PEZI|nr:hypothetical protein FKW77_002254 [Venturia effusa]
MHSATSITAIAALVSVASAHMFMKTPKPFGHDENGDPITTAPYGAPNILVSSPLGLDTVSGTTQHFPCQFGPDFKYPTSDATTVAAGSSTILTFQGTAVHGGGSCQISLAKTPSADFKDWHVIHSIIGGCPGTNAPGAGLTAGTAGGQDNFKVTNANKPDAPQCTDVDTDELTCLKKYNIPIPKELASGKYFLAWTWFNKIGNREMYMNCAYLDVTGGGTSDDWLNKQPAIFYANVEEKPCTTGQGFSLDFPAPGDSVLRSSNPFDNVDVNNQGMGQQCAALNPPQSSKPAHVATLKAAGGGDSSSTPATSASDLPITATSTVGTTTVTASAPSTNVSVPTAPTSSANKPVLVAPGASSAPAAPVASSIPSTSAAACAHPCTEDGKLVCLPSNQFGICNHGCLVPQTVAAGTSCQNGAIAGGANGKRSINLKDRVMKPRRAPLRKSVWNA